MPSFTGRRQPVRVQIVNGFRLSDERAVAQNKRILQ
jgi:hypothetical protein